MKKIARIISLLIVLTLSLGALWLVASADNGTEAEAQSHVPKIEIPDTVRVTAGGELASAGYSYVLYSDEAAFLSDVSEGVIDGLNALGEEVVIGNSSDAAFPSSGYMCLLKDYKYSKAYNTSGTLSINLNGRTYTVELPTMSPTATTVNGTLNIFGGTLVDGFSFNLPTVTVNAGGVLNIKDATIKVSVGWENQSTFFNLASGVTVNMENVTVDHTGKQTSVIRAASGTSTVNLKKVTYNGSTNHTTYNPNFNSNSAYAGFLYAYGGSLNVNADKDTAATAGYFVNKSKATLQVNLNLELGFSMAYPDFNNGYLMNEEDRPTKSWNVATKISYYENGAPLTNGLVKFCENNGIYVLRLATPVYWYDVYGNLARTDELSAGEIPVSIYGEVVYTDEDGNIYIHELGGYSSVKGGSAVEFLPIVKGETERRYYPIVESKARASVAVFDGAEGELILAWEEQTITREQLGKIPAGAYVRLYDDVVAAADAQTKAEGRLDNWNDGIVIDLCGFDISYIRSGAIRKLWVAIGGQTITFKNGSMTLVGETVVECKAADAVVNFIDVDVVSDGMEPIFNLGNGTLNVYGGSLDAGGYLVLSISAVSANPVIRAGFYGVDAKAATFLSVITSLSSTANATNPAVATKNDIVVDVTDRDGVYSQIEANNLVYFSRLNSMGRESKININLSRVFAKISDKFMNKSSIKGSWATWYDSASNSMVSDASLDASRIVISVDRLYTNKEIAPIKTETVKINGKMQSVVSDMSDYTIAYAPVDSFGLMVNLTLHSDFDFNVYLLKNSTIAKILCNGEVVFDLSDPTTYREWEEDYYVFTIADIAPNSAAAKFNFAIIYTDEAGLPCGDSVTMNYTAQIHYSVVDYLGGLLEDASQSAAVKNLAKAMSVYIKTTYTYFAHSEADAELMSMLDSLISTYNAEAYVSSFEIKTPEADTDFDTALGVSASFAVASKTRLTLSFSAPVVFSIVDSKGSVVLTDFGASCELIKLMGRSISLVSSR